MWPGMEFHNSIVRGKKLYLNVSVRANKVERLSLWKLRVEEGLAKDKKAVFEMRYELLIMLCKNFNDSTSRRTERGSSFSSCRADEGEK